MKCQYCNKDAFLPFRCPFCKGYFCAEHRLPENHKCPEYWKAKIPRAETPTVTFGRSFPRDREYTEQVIPLRAKPKTSVFWFSLTELKHLAVGTLLVMGVGMSLFWSTTLETPVVLVSLAVVFTLAFLLHELAHKLTAQHHGLWAEFRVTTIGALITLLSILPTPFKIISPGAVMIAGSATRETLGKVSLAGPLTNLALSAVSAGAAAFLPVYLSQVAFISAFFNAFIAFFNLIPFTMLDGLKVFRWNKAVWIAAFLLAVALATWAFINVQWIF